MVWRAVDRKPTEFIAALKMPSKLWNFFQQLDSTFGIMERKYLDKKQKEGAEASKLPPARKR